MDFAHITPEQYLRQPWRNGGGTTSELAKHVFDGRILWRVSIADVTQSGPFSDFTGYDRTIMLLKGNGFVLSSENGEAPLDEKRLDQLYQPFEFSGDSRTQCRLINGPVEDFNFMVDRQRASGRLDVQELHGVAITYPVPDAFHVLVCLRGSAEVTCDEKRFVLKAGETLRIDRRGDQYSANSMEFRALALPCSLAIASIR